MMRFPTEWKNKIHVPNNQPGMICVSPLIIFNHETCTLTKQSKRVGGPQECSFRLSKPTTLNRIACHCHDLHLLCLAGLLKPSLDITRLHTETEADADRLEAAVVVPVR